eukprot:11234294-Karenia_brevis.AAC.1
MEKGYQKTYSRSRHHEKAKPLTCGWQAKNWNSADSDLQLMKNPSKMLNSAGTCPQQMKMS